MIAVKLEGRLGNQLFQYAFIYAAAKKLNAGFYLDKSIENFLLPQYFKVENDFLVGLDRSIFSVNGYKNLFSIHAKKTFYRLLSAAMFRAGKVTISNAEPVQDALKQLKNSCLYEGFFHSETYFGDFKNNIRALYQIKEKHVLAFEAVKKNLNPSKKKMVIHVRRGDYIDLGIALPVSYYKKAIETIKATDIEYIFISDDPGFIETAFSYIPNKYISIHTEIIDLQLLMNADICILSNSSFSWWGAWLNSKQNKQVIAPKYWLGAKEQKEFPTGVADGMDFMWIEA